MFLVLLSSASETSLSGVNEQEDKVRGMNKRTNNVDKYVFITSINNNTLASSKSIKILDKSIYTYYHFVKFICKENV